MTCILYMMILLLMKLKLGNCRLIDDRKPNEVCWDTVKEVTGAMTLCPSGHWTGVGSFTDYHLNLAKGMKKAQREMLDLKEKLVKNRQTEEQDSNSEGNSYQLSNSNHYHFSGPKDIGTPIHCLKSCTVTISYTDRYGFIITHSNVPLHTQPALDTLRYHLDHPGRYQFVSNQIQWYEEVYTKLSPGTKSKSSREDPSSSIKKDLMLTPQLPDAIIHYERI